MKNFDNFDESVRNKLDETNFQFNESNWEKMSQMIDASRPAKKPFASTAVISSIIIGGAIIISSAWYLVSQTSNTNEVAENNKTVIMNVSNNSNSNASNTNLSSQNIENALGTTNNDAITSSNNSSEVSAIENQSETTTTNAKDIAASSSTKNKYSDENKKMDNTPNIQSESNLIPASDSKAKNTTNSNTKTKDPIGETEGAHKKSNGMNLASNTPNKNDSKTPSLEINSEQDVVTQEAPSEVNVEENEIEQTEIIALQSTTTNLGQTADAIAAANLKTALDDKKLTEYVRIKHHTLNIEAGISNSFGWKVNNTRNGNNISPIIGLNYKYSIDSRSSFLIGLQYNNLSNLGEAKANFSITTYGFGVNNDVTTYKLNELHYAVMPLKFIYTLNKNNALGVGFNMMYLINTRTEIINTTSIESNVSTTQRHNEYGYGFDQLNKWNGQMALSYNYKISKTLGMNLEVNKSLSNIVKDYQYFGIKNQSSAPAAIKLSLTYTLLNK